MESGHAALPQGGILPRVLSLCNLDNEGNGSPSRKVEMKANVALQVVRIGTFEAAFGNWTRYGLRTRTFY